MFSMLPNELEERIHKMAWESVYHENIIQQLEFHLIKMNKLDIPTKLTLFNSKGSMGP